MNRQTQAFLMAASIAALLPVSPVRAVVVDTSFGFNYVSSTVYLNGEFIPLGSVELNSITYWGEYGLQTLAMPAGFTDTWGVNYDPTIYPPTDIDGASTRTSYTQPLTLPIDWNRPGQMTSWGQTYSFPTIGITGITAVNVSGTLYSDSVYVVGLIGEWTGSNELDSLFGNERGDIYDTSRAATFVATDFIAPNYADGDFIFSAASTVSIIPVPAAIWLLGSGILGLAAVAPRRRDV